jgi:hypothetical protein
MKNRAPSPVAIGLALGVPLCAIIGIPPSWVQWGCCGLAWVLILLWVHERFKGAPA